MASRRPAARPWTSSFVASACLRAVTLVKAITTPSITFSLVR
jgi:hypothetical protein